MEATSVNGRAHSVSPIRADTTVRAHCAEPALSRACARMCHHATECAPILCVPCVGSSAYTGPYSGAGGGPTDNVMTFTRFKRSGNTLRQWYKIDSDMSATYPRTDSEWTPVSDYGGASISISPSDNVVILLGEAGSPAGGSGDYMITCF